MNQRTVPLSMDHLAKWIVGWTVTILLSAAAVGARGSTPEDGVPEGKGLVYGGQLMDRFLPMPVQGKLTSETWGLIGLSAAILTMALKRASGRTGEAKPGWLLPASTTSTSPAGEMRLVVTICSSDEREAPPGKPRGIRRVWSAPSRQRGKRQSLVNFHQQIFTWQSNEAKRSDSPSGRAGWGLFV